MYQIVLFGPNISEVATPSTCFKDILGDKFGNIVLIALAISAFPSACFSSLIAANSFKTTMPKVNPSISVGLGALVAVILAVTGWVSPSDLGLCYHRCFVWPHLRRDARRLSALRRKNGTGPRAGFNPAGWLSWLFGFIVGAFNLFAGMSGCPYAAKLAAWNTVPPVAAFIVGFVLYLVFSLLGMKTKTLEMPESAK